LKKISFFAATLLAVWVSVFLITLKEHTENQPENRVLEVNKHPPINRPAVSLRKEPLSQTKFLDSTISDDICKLTQCSLKNASITFHHFQYVELNTLKAGDTLDIPIPGETPIKIVITNTESSEKILTISGHLYNYPDYYLTSISIDTSDITMGTTMSEKSNFEIRTTGGQTFIFKVIPEMEVFMESDT
jgi:hypothetical protein